MRVPRVGERGVDVALPLDRAGFGRHCALLRGKRLRALAWDVPPGSSEGGAGDADRPGSSYYCRGRLPTSPPGPHHTFEMRAIKFGALSSLLVAAVLALLWVTEAMPRSDVADMAPKAFGAIVVLVLTGVLLTALRGDARTPDNTDKPVP